MRGPFLPLYGCGAIMMLLVSIPFRDNLLLTYVAGCVGATALEYVTGVVMEALFKVRYWDYSDRKFNFQGHICLAATLAWGTLTLIMTKWIHGPIESFVLWLPQWLVSLCTVLVSICCVADFSVSFKTALDIRDVLVKLEEVREEMERMQKRLDVIIAFTEDSKEQAVLNTYERLDELTTSLEARFERVKELREKLDLKVTGLSEGIKERSEEWKERSEEWKERSQDRREEWKEKAESYKEELEEMRIRFRVDMETRFQLLHKKDFNRKSMLLHNPMMKSRYFKSALEDMKKATKEAAEERKRKKK